MVRPAARLLLALAALFLSALAPAHAERRIALVIGNGAYIAAPALRNPPNDARAVAASLRRIGFEVIEGIDEDYSALRRTIRDFGERLPGAATALFFYAGHGVQVAGENYLIPIDARLTSETDLDFAAVAVDLVLKQMDRAAKTKIVILDACRNNPFEAEMARSMGATRAAGLGRGLAEIRAIGGSLISFATDPGSVAADGEGGNSPFTEALLQHLETPGLEINVMMARVRADVYAATGERQRPWTTTSLIGEVYLTPPEAAPPPAASATPVAPPVATPATPPVAHEIEMELWRSAERGGLKADYESYLRKYPEGHFADLAHNRIDALSEPPAAPAATTLATPPAGGAVAAPPQATGPSPEGVEAALGLTLEDRASVQVRLSMLGYDPRGVDGVFGAGSRAAIREWQDDEGFAATGYLDLDQIARLVADTEADYQAWMGSGQGGIQGGGQGFGAASSVFSAYAYCSITGAEGYGQNADPNQALWEAVNACIFNGGVPQCCANGAQLLQ